MRFVLLENVNSVIPLFAIIHDYAWYWTRLRVLYLCDIMHGSEQPTSLWFLNGFMCEETALHTIYDCSLSLVFFYGGLLLNVFTCMCQGAAVRLKMWRDHTYSMVRLSGFLCFHGGRLVGWNVSFLSIEIKRRTAM